MTEIMHALHFRGYFLTDYVSILMGILEEDLVVPTIRIILALSLSLVFSFPAYSVKEKVAVTCYCQTKKNPSWCNSGSGFFEEYRWDREAYNSERKAIDWDDDFLRTYCYRHRDESLCMCDDESLFRGELVE